MDFSLSEDQQMLRTAARSFLKTNCQSKYVKAMRSSERGFAPEQWKAMVDMGWLGLAFPEEYGGTGGSFLDLIVLLEEMGRACLPGPFFSTVVLGGFTLLETGNEQQKSLLLPAITSGKKLLTLAITEPGMTRYDPCNISVKAVPEKDGYLIQGTKLFVSDAHIVDYIICVARTGNEACPGEDITLFLIDAKEPGTTCNLLQTIDGSKQCEVVFNNACIAKENILGEVNQGRRYLNRLLQKAAVAKCGEMVGGAQMVLEMATAYAKDRTQFGRPIGSFQAVQHHCADMLILVDGARYATYKAAWMLSEGLPCQREVAVAKAWTSNAYKQVCLLGHQILGGVGYMIDHDLPLYSTRAKADELAFGDALFHQAVVADELGL